MDSDLESVAADAGCSDAGCFEPVLEQVCICLN